MMTKGNVFMNLKCNFRCQFVYTLHGVLAKLIFRSCVTRDGAICIKMAHLSILMEPTLLLEKTSATVSYNVFGSYWYLNVASMLAAQVTRTESYVYVVEQAQCFSLEHQQQTEKKTYKSLSSDRSEKIPDGSCSILFLEIDLQERVFQQIFMIHMI